MPPPAPHLSAIASRHHLELSAIFSLNQTSLSAKHLSHPLSHSVSAAAPLSQGQPPSPLPLLQFRCQLAPTLRYTRHLSLSLSVNLGSVNLERKANQCQYTYTLPLSLWFSGILHCGSQLFFCFWSWFLLGIRVRWVGVSKTDKSLVG